MVVRKVANPAPAVLALVNPRRRKKVMATKRRRRSTKRRRVVRARARTSNPINPTRRRRSRRRTSVFARARRRNPINPTRRRRVGRRRARRNPFIGGAGGEILNFTIAGIAQGMAQPFVAGFAGRFLPFGQYNAPIISFGTGWLLSQAFNLFGFTKRFSKPAFIFGAATAAMQVLQPIVARTLGGGGNPTMQGYRNRMRGIGVMTNIPPGMGVPMIAAPNGANAGMNGIGVMTNIPPGMGR